jgi:hypothetical protein
MKFAIFSHQYMFLFWPTSGGYSLCENFVTKSLLWIHVVSSNGTMFSYECCMLPSYVLFKIFLIRIKNQQKLTYLHVTKLIEPCAHLFGPEYIIPARNVPVSFCLPPWRQTLISYRPITWLPLPDWERKATHVERPPRSRILLLTAGWWTRHRKFYLVVFSKSSLGQSPACERKAVPCCNDPCSAVVCSTGCDRASVEALILSCLFWNWLFDNTSWVVIRDCYFGY